MKERKITWSRGEKNSSLRGAVLFSEKEGGRVPAKGKGDKIVLHLGENGGRRRNKKSFKKNFRFERGKKNLIHILYHR